MSYRDLEARLSCKIDGMRKRKRAGSPMKIWRNIRKGPKERDGSIVRKDAGSDISFRIYVSVCVCVEELLVGVGEAD
jgi:hypothetical protein